MFAVVIKRSIFTLLFASVSVACFAQEDVPTRRILPSEVVPQSVKLIPLSTNTFAVRWTYTEAGASNLLAFWETHQGQKVRTAIGTFESPAAEVPLHIPSAGDPAYNRWKQGWLQRRTDKFVVASQDDADKILDGLKGKR